MRAMNWDEFAEGRYPTHPWTRKNLTGRQAEVLRIRGIQDHSLSYSADSSIEFNEFYQNFRTDRFKREDFFWGKVRPFTTLSREDRLALAAKLGEETGISRTVDEILQIVQRKVDFKGLRKMYSISS